MASPSYPTLRNHWLAWNAAGIGDGTPMTISSPSYAISDDYALIGKSLCGGGQWRSP